MAELRCARPAPIEMRTQDENALLMRTRRMRTRCPLAGGRRAGLALTNSLAMTSLPSAWRSGTAAMAEAMEAIRAATFSMVKEGVCSGGGWGW